MNPDDLKEEWKERHRNMANDGTMDLASSVMKRATCFERKILRRDLIETVAASAVILFFGYFVWLPCCPWIAKLGMVIGMLGALEVGIVLHLTRRQGGRPDGDLPLSEYCAAEIARIDRQIRLLRNVNWWYTGPLLLGAAVFMFGVLYSVSGLPVYLWLPAFAVFCLLDLICGWIIYGINQQAVCQDLVPFRDELAAISKSLTDEPQMPDEAE